MQLNELTLKNEQSAPSFTYLAFSTKLLSAWRWTYIVATVANASSGSLPHDEQVHLRPSGAGTAQALSAAIGHLSYLGVPAASSREWIQYSRTQWTNLQRWVDSNSVSSHVFGRSWLAKVGGLLRDHPQNPNTLDQPELRLNWWFWQELLIALLRYENSRPIKAAAVPHRPKSKCVKFFFVFFLLWQPSAWCNANVTPSPSLQVLQH